MRPTLINHEQVEIVEKIIAGLSEAEILTKSVSYLVDKDTGEPLQSEDTGDQATITVGWDSGYIKEAFVTVIDAFLLSEKVHLVCPLKDNVAIIPHYSKLVPRSTEFLSA